MATPPSNVIAAALEVHAFCKAKKWDYCIIGGLAVQRWANPRFTQDVDLTVLTGYGQEERYVAELLGSFRAREPDAATFAIRTRVVLARTKKGIPIDISLGAVPFEEASVRRATLWRVHGSRSIRTCTAEDLIVHKVFAGRARDWSDVEGVLTRQIGKLDQRQIRADLMPLLELNDAPERWEEYERMVARANAVARRRK